MISNKYMTDAQKKLYQDTFHDSEEFITYLSQRDDAVTYSNDEGTSQVTIVDKDIVIQGKRIKSKFMIGACTRSDLRGRGLFRELFSEIESSIDADIIFTFPEDSRREYYTRLGFEVFNRVEYRTLDQVVGKGTIIECYDSKLLSSIYDNYVSKHQIYQYRDIDTFNDIVRAVRADDSKIYLIGYDGAFSYAIVTDNEIVEYIDLDAVRSVGSFREMKYNIAGDTPYAIYKIIGNNKIREEITGLEDKLYFSRYY